MTYLFDKHMKLFFTRIPVKKTYQRFLPAINVEAYATIKGEGEITLVFDKLVLDAKGNPTSKSRPEGFRHLAPVHALRLAAALAKAYQALSGGAYTDNDVLIRIRDELRGL